MLPGEAGRPAIATGRFRFRALPADIEMLNRRYRRLMDTLDSRPTISITYFRPDERKEGGAYLTVTGVVRKLDPAARRIIMQDGTVIPTAEISAMEGEIFSDMDEW